MKGETGRRWSVALGRKEGRKEVTGADMCNNHSVSRLTFRGEVAKLHDPFCAFFNLSLFTCSSRFRHPVQGWLNVTAAERAPPG